MFKFNIYVYVDKIDIQLTLSNIFYGFSFSWL